MSDATRGVTRRDMIGLTLGAGASAIAVGALSGGRVAALPFAPEALSAPIAGARYMGIDAYEFWPDRAQDRIYQDMTGSQPINPNTRLWAPLRLPAGAIVVQMSASYQGEPIFEINRRPLLSGGTAVAPQQLFQKTFAASPGGPFATTEAIPNIQITRDATYTVSAYCGAGTSVLGVGVGYLEGFIPFTGETPRVLDSRKPPAPMILKAGTERVVQLGLPGRVAVINLAVAQTTGAGFVAAFAADRDWPGNASVNFATANALVSNAVLCEMDDTGSIRLRAGSADTHVVVDRVGSLV